MKPEIYNIYKEEDLQAIEEWYDSIKLMPCDFIIEEVNYE